MTVQNVVFIVHMLHNRDEAGNSNSNMISYFVF